MTEIRLDVEADEPGAGSGRGAGAARRSRWIVAYLVAATVLTGAVGYFIDVVGGDPDDVVGDYLAAVLDADPEAALAIAGVKPKDDDPRDEFLDAAALRADWEITSVATRRQSETGAIVDAKITGRDGPRAGVFRLERRGGSDWRIGNPFVPLYLSRPPLWADGDRERNRLTVNGKSVTVPESPAGLSSDGGIQLRLFPGSYAFFAAGEPLVKPVEAVRTWLPPGDSTSLVPYTPRLSLSGKGFRLADTAVRDLLRGCDGAVSPSPEGCPFGGSPEGIDDDGTEYRIDAESAAWKVGDIPKLYFADTGFGYFRPVSREPFTVELSFTDDGKHHTVDCGVAMESLAFGLSTKGEVVFAGLDDSPQTCP